MITREEKRLILEKVKRRLDTFRIEVLFDYYGLDGSRPRGARFLAKKYGRSVEGIYGTVITARGSSSSWRRRSVLNWPGAS